MTVPERIHTVLGAPGDIKCLPLPFKTEPITSTIVWRERFHHGPGHHWIRSIVTSLFEEKGDHPVAQLDYLHTSRHS
jgi:DNA-binding transcriptional LysR family regulator